MPLVFACLLLVPFGTRGLGWRLPLALGVPVAIAMFALYGWPRDAWQWIAFVPVAGVIAGTAMAAAGRGGTGDPWRRMIAHALLAAAVAACLWPVTSRDPWPIRVVPAVATLALGLGLEPLADRRTGALLPAALLCAAIASAVVIMLSEWMQLSVPVVALAMTLAVCVAVALRRRDLSLAGGALATTAPMLAATPLVAWLYMSAGKTVVPAMSFVLPSAAPLLAWAALPRRRLAPVAALAAAALAAGAAIVIALTWGPEEATIDPLEKMYEEMMRSQ